MKGITAPPTMAVFRTPEPSPVNCPSSAIPLVNIDGNMMELKKPTKRMLHIAKWPSLNTDVITSRAAHAAQRPSICDVFIATCPPPDDAHHQQQCKNDGAER